MDSESTKHTPEEHSNEDQVVEELVTDYIDRINRGEILSSKTILADHPRIGKEVLGHLQEFIDLGAELESPAFPRTLGDYTLRRQIGRGGMGVVYDAWQNSMNRQVALKVLPAGIAADRRACARFMREAQTAGQLNHSNIVSVHAMGIDENTPYYAMEFVEGETLAQILARTRDAEPETETPFGKKDDVAYFGNMARAFADLADGLQHAHSKGVTHRDIKPSNLILDGDGRLRILDFGLARLEGQESLTISGDVVGTPLYMSPEQARRKKMPVDHRTDVYSLGATMYEAICGRPPFRGKDHADTLSQIIERDPVDPCKFNPRVPRDAETIVLKCLRKDAADRYGTAEAMAQDLRRFVRGDPIEARPQTRLQILCRKLRRHARALSVASGCLVLTALVCVFALKSHHDTQRANRVLYDSVINKAVARMPWSRPGLRPYVIDDMVMGGDQFLPGDARLLAGREGLETLREVEGDLAEFSVSVPERPEARYYRGQALFLLGRTEEALAALRSVGRDLGFVPALVLADEISGADPWSSPDPAAGDHGERWRDWLVAQRAMAAGRWQEAEEAYDVLADSASELYLGSSLDLLLGRGYARWKLGDPHGAIEDFSAARDRWPKLVEPALLLAKTYYLDGYRPGAWRALDRLYRTSGSRDIAAFWITALYTSLRDYEQAIAWAEKVTKEAEALRERLKAVVFLRWSRPHEAIECAERAIQLEPNDVHARLTKATALIFLYLNNIGPRKRRAEATIRTLAKEALDLAPESAETLSFYGLVFEDDSYIEAARKVDRSGSLWRARLAFLRWIQGKHREAEQEIRTVLRDHEHDETLHALLGVTLVHQGKTEAARAAFEWAVKLRPDFWEAIQMVGRTLELEERDAEALEYLERAVAYPTQRNAAHEALAHVLWKLNRPEEAVRTARDAMEIAPDTTYPHWVLQGALEGLLAKTLEGGGQLGPAAGLEGPIAELEGPVEGLEEILESPEVPAKFLVSGALLRLYGKKGRDPRRALEYASRAVETADGGAAALSARAQAYLAAGDLADAARDVECLLDEDKDHRFYQLLSRLLDERLRGDSEE